MKTIAIDNTFKDLIPPLAPSEYDALQESILQDGCREPLVVWQRGDEWTLLDGHNRYRICNEFGIPFDTKVMLFIDRNAAMMWMIRNQIGRRNLTPFSRGELVNKFRDIIAASARANQVAGGLGANLPNPPVHTREALADMADISGRTMDKVVKVVNDAPESIVKMARAGDIAIDHAYNLTRSLETADAEVVSVVEQYEITDVKVVDTLKRLKQGKHPTFDEIVRSGFIQPGDEQDAVSIKDSYDKIEQALKLKSDYYGYERVNTAEVYLPNAEVTRQSPEQILILLPEGVYLPDGWRDGLYTVKITPRKGERNNG